MKFLKKRKMKKIDEAKRWFFENINIIDKHRVD